MHWLPPMFFAITASVLLFTIYRLTAVKYSKNRTSPSLTLAPYYVIVVYLTFELVEIVCVLYQVSTNDSAQKVSSIESAIWPGIITLSIAKFAVFGIFANVILGEWIVHCTFILFQQDLSLNVLQVKRSKYHALEFKMLSVFKVLSVIALVPFLIEIVTLWWYYFSLMHMFEHPWVLNNFLHILEWVLFGIFMYQVLCAFLISLAVISILPFMLYKMRSHHRLVFNSHWVGLTMQGAALISTSLIIGAKNYVGASTLLCIITDGVEFLAYNMLLGGRHH